MISRDDVLRRQGELEELRRPEEATWREIARLFEPDERAIGAAHETPKDDPYADIFDASPLYAREAFAGGLFNQATNPTLQWIDFGWEDDGLKAWGPARAHIAAVSAIFWRSLGPAYSQFYTEAYPWFSQTASFGFASLYDEPDLATGTFLERVVPMGECFIDVDMWGRIDTQHRRFRLKGRQLMKRFPGLANIVETRDYTVIHAVVENPGFQPGKIGAAGKPWLSVYCSPEAKDLWRVEGYYEFPYHNIVWSRRPGRVWPRGPGHIARPDASMLQEMERTHLVGMQLRAEPPVATTEESALVAEDLQPGRVLYGAMSDQGKRLAEPLPLGDDIGLSMQHAEAKRAAVREAFQFSLMNLINRPQMTATEVLAFQEEKLRLMAPNLTRVQQALGSFATRRLKTLDRLGLLPPPPPDLAGRALTIEFVSPLAKAQKTATGQATLRWIGALAPFAQLDPTIFDAVDFDAVAEVTHESFGPPPQVLRPAEKIDEIRRGRAEAAAQQSGLEQAQVSASVFAEMAHAQQAQSRAQERRKA